jgi:hypothetical protein
VVTPPAPRGSRVLRFLVRGFLVLASLLLGALAWDVWQLRAMKPPRDRTFEGFVGEGRQGSLLIDAAGDRLYWIAPRPGMFVRNPEPPVYEFDRSGQLVNWTPGTEKGMLLDVPVRRRGREAGVEQARAWLRSK